MNKESILKIRSPEIIKRNAVPHYYFIATLIIYIFVNIAQITGKQTC